MKVVIKNSFTHDTKKIRDKKLLAEIEATIKKAEFANDVSEILQLKKLKGYKQYFRIRIGDYRIGVSIERNEVRSRASFTAEKSIGTSRLNEVCNLHPISNKLKIINNSLNKSTRLYLVCIGLFWLVFEVINAAVGARAVVGPSGEHGANGGDWVRAHHD